MEVSRRPMKKSGKVRVTLDLAPDEVYLVLKADRYYSLGYPIEDVVPTHVIADSKLVSWDPVSQKWD